MRVGTISTLPNEYTRFATIQSEYGNSYSVELGEVPLSAEEGDEYAYRLELWGGNSGIAYKLTKDD